MGIQINGQTDRISAVDGSFSIQDLAEVNVTGVATASNFKSGTSNVHSTGYECTNINATGIVTAASANFTGNVSVGGTLTYQDVTNIDSVGVITARSGVNVTGGSIGIGTVSPSGPIHAHVASGTQRSYLEASASHSFLRLKSGSTSYNSGLEFFSGASNIANVTGLGAGGLLFEVNGSEGLRVGSDGKLTSTRTSTTAYDPAATTNDRNFLLLNHGAAGHATLQFQSLSGGTAQTGQATISSFNETAGSKNTALTFGTRQNSDATIRERVRITSDGKVLINSTANSDAQLLVKSADKLHPALKIDGLSSNGFSLFGDEYATDESHFTMGIAYSSASLVTGWGVKVSSTASNEYLSSQDTYATRHSATRHDNDGWRFLSNSSSQTVTTDSVVSISERFRLSADGKVHVGGNGTGTDQLNIIGAGNGINISRANSGSPSANDSLGALGFKGYATGNSSAAADAKIHAAASHNHSGSSAPANLIFSTKPTTTGPGSSPTERMRLTHDGELLIGGTAVGGACRLGMSFGNSTGNYIEMGGTSRTANGLSKLAVMRHGYWGGAREVGSIGFLTSSSGGGAGRGTGNFVVHTGTSGNGDAANSGDNLSIERLRVDSGGVFYVNTSSANNWSQTSNSSNTDTGNTNDISGNMCFRTTQGALVIANDADSGYSAIYINKYDWNSGDDNRWINFYLNGAGKDSITWNGSNIVYGNNSDYRIKTNIRSYTGGINLVKQIQVRQYDYIETERGTDHVGFIAHELQEVIPDAVSGEKDAMRTEEETGEEVMDIQNVDYGRVTPILTAALKEAIAKIETLEARITALEG